MLYGEISCRKRKGTTVVQPPIIDGKRVPRNFAFLFLNFFVGLFGVQVSRYRGRSLLQSQLLLLSNCFCLFQQFERSRATVHLSEELPVFGSELLVETDDFPQHFSSTKNFHQFALLHIIADWPIFKNSFCRFLV